MFHAYVGGESETYCSSSTIYRTHVKVSTLTVKNKTEEATDVTPTEEKSTEASAAHFHGVRNSGIAR